MNGTAQAQPRAPKNIIICSDGTGNTANKDRGTNVFKLYEAVDLNGHLTDPALTPQIAFYDDGVGTETFKPVRVLGGAVGWGLSRNVRQLYAALVRSYDPGDRVFLFGFSRGAFTVRTLGGFIAACGILDRANYGTDADLREAVKQAYRTYRSKYKYLTGTRKGVKRVLQLARRGQRQTQPVKPPQFVEKVRGFREKHRGHDPKIAFIGVWDTVDAVGVPFDHLADFINDFIYPFKFADLTLSPKVEQGRHAISVDDERHTFHPVMWDESAGGERIKQVWFAGVHSNVGGGYPKQGMSLVSLDWMMAEAERAGLRFIEEDRDYYRAHENVNDKLYNSRAGLAVYYRYKPRDIHEICGQSNASAKIHETVIERIKQSTEGYAPGNLSAGLNVVATGNNATRYPNAAASVANAYGNKTSLLDGVKIQVRVRRVSHYAFVILSALALLWYASKPVLAGQQGIVAKLSVILSIDGLCAIGKKLFALLSIHGIADLGKELWGEKDPLLIAMIVSIIGFFWVIVMAEKSMWRRFSAFWHTVSPRL